MAAAAVVALGVIAVTAGAGPAAPPPALELDRDVPPALKAPKLDATLAGIDDVAAAQGASAAASRAAALGLDTAGTRVEVEVATRDAGDAAGAIAASGGSIRSQYRGLLEAVVPPGALDQLAAQGAIRYVGRPVEPQPAAVVDEGVAATGADAWQGAGTSGKGVKVAIIDVGFRGWHTQQATGDLPAAVTAVDFCGPGGFDGVDADEHGTAVAEIVHDMAPDAQLYLICVDTLASLGQAKDYVVGKGIPIVNHSVGWYNTARGDGTGVAASPDAIVADARVHGVLWINSAGNDAQKHWSGTFTDTDGNHWNEFAPGDEGNGVLLDTGQELCAYLKWDDWPASAQDYDLYLYRQAGAVLVAGSTNLQSGTQQPTEALCYTNPGAFGFFDVAVRRDAVTQTPRLDLFTTRGPLQYNTTSGSLAEPASSPHAVTVGAECWAETSLEPYSSQGPTIDGRIKPDLTGPDGVSTASIAQQPLTLPCSGRFGFFGTSASAPHVTGAAALLKQANPTFGPAQLQAGLEASATDLGAPGKDNLYGSGLLALGGAPTAPAGPPTGSVAPTITGMAQQARTLTAGTGGWTGPAVVLYAYQWRRCAAPGTPCVDIPGALGATYTATASDIQSTLRVEVTAINTGGATSSVSTPTASVLPLPPANSTAPAITGRARLAYTLTGSQGTWAGYAPLSYATDWRRCSAAGDACVSTGVTAQSYVVGPVDVGATLRVAVIASNAGGSTTAVSAPSAVVLPSAPENTAAPKVSGATIVGATLQASTGGWTGATDYAYRWWRCVGSVCAYVDAATASTFRLRSADVGATFRGVVTASNAGGSTTASSSPTARVAAAAGARIVLAAGSIGHNRPRAGHMFTVQMRVARRPAGAAVAGQTTCTARIGGRALRAARHTLAGGVARCSWSLPRTAAGKRLSGSVRATAKGASVTRRFSVLVGRR